jgi:hypothetical protein
MDRHSGENAEGSAVEASDWPHPRKGADTDVAVTHLLIVRDVERSRRFYGDVLGRRC